MSERYSAEWYEEQRRKGARVRSGSEPIARSLEKGDRVKIVQTGATGTLIRFVRKRDAGVLRRCAIVRWDSFGKEGEVRAPEKRLEVIPCDWPRGGGLMGASAHEIGHPGCARRYRTGAPSA